ncbi:MAG TPA: hypothetical protein VD788_12565, partial [Candidatus Polarisedimenticolaceae bacterium]|nr:hypothetical protein [Candidatus Polarisedimenticolaceae bacterium]
LDRKLNRKASKGWIASRAGSTETVLTLERMRGEAADATSAQDVFLALTSTRSDFSSRMARAVDAGYRYLGLFVEAGQTTVLLQKQPDSTASARSSTRREPEADPGRSP